MRPHHGAILCAAAALATGCDMLAPVATAPEPESAICPRIGHFEDRASLLSALPDLYAIHHRDLIVIAGSVYLSACSADHLGGASEGSRLGGAGENSRLGGLAEQGRLASAGEQSRLASAGEDSRLDSAAEQSRIGSAAEQSRLAGAGEGSRVGSAGELSRIDSAGENSRVGSVGENSRVGSVGESSRVGSVGESSRLGGAATVLQCKPCQTELGYELNAPHHRTVRIFDGVQLWRVDGGQLVPEESPPATPH